MLDLGWQEFFLIATIAVVVVGPKDLPKVIRTIVGWIRKVRSMARDFQGSIEEVAREAELDEIRQEAAKLKGTDLKQTILDTVDPDRDLSDSLKEAKADIEAGTQPVENTMLDPALAESRAAEAQIVQAKAETDPAETSRTSSETASGEESAIKGWDAESVTTPASSITPPSTAEAQPADEATPTSADEATPTSAKKPRAAKKASATKSVAGAPEKATRKTTVRKTATRKTAAGKVATGAAKAKAPPKARKPRAKAKPEPAATTTVETGDTPVTEA